MPVQHVNGASRPPNKQRSSHTKIHSGDAGSSLIIIKVMARARVKDYLVRYAIFCLADIVRKVLLPEQHRKIMVARLLSPQKGLKFLLKTSKMVRTHTAPTRLAGSSQATRGARR